MLFLAEHLSLEALWGQIGTAVLAALAALIAYLNRRAGKVQNGSGRKEDLGPVLVDKLNTLHEKVDILGARLDEHTKSRGLFGRHG